MRSRRAQMKDLVLYFLYICGDFALWKIQYGGRNHFLFIFKNMAIILPGYIKLDSLAQKFSSMWQPFIVFVLNISPEKFGLKLYFSNIEYIFQILGCKICGISLHLFVILKSS